MLIASDPDREGENLGNHIKDLLKLKNDQYYRISYHSISKSAIEHALDNPRKMDEALVNAAEARQVIDKMIGFALSPIAKTYVGAKSVGRCQSIGLKLIVDREREIENFVPERYFDIYLDFLKHGVEFRAKYAGTDASPVDHLKAKEDAALVVAQCENGKFSVKDIERKEKQQSPQPPFCTATYQQEAATKLGLKVKDAMSCAQKLFEGIQVNGEHVGLITYMRTDATDLAPDFLPELRSYIDGAYGAGTFTSPRVGKKSASDQEGHEALRVVSVNMTPAKLSSYLQNPLLLKVYELIWKRTVAAAMPNAVISETTYDIYNGAHKFVLKSNEVTKPGFKQVYGYDEADADTITETFSKGEELRNTSLDLQEKQTQPKPRYKEGTLIKELQKREIGRPSTYATIVDTVLSPTRGYCELKGKEIVPTDKGRQLASFLDRAFPNIINYDYTKNMEVDLDMIANGEMKELDFLNGFYSSLEKAIADNTEQTIGQEETKICPKCGAPMVVRRSRFGKLFYGCTNYPKCNGIVPLQQ